MESKRISDKMEKLLNTQMTREAFQAQAYLAYASWAEVNSFAGAASFLYKHMQEERGHMFKILKYINDRGGSAKIEAIDAPGANPKNLKECFEKILKHEVNNSKEIDKIVDLAHEEKDWATFNFGQWFVKEQIEEETLIKRILDKYTLASNSVKNNANLYDMDKDLNEASQEIDLPREEEF